jgi:hypothetical protein
MGSCSFLICILVRIVLTDTQRTRNLSRKLSSRPQQTADVQEPPTSGHRQVKSRLKIVLLTGLVTVSVGTVTGGDCASMMDLIILRLFDHPDLR